MINKFHNHLEGEKSQVLHNGKSGFFAPSGSLWNTAMGRRTFLKRTGAASVATAVAVHGFRVQVQAQATGNIGVEFYTYSLKCTDDPTGGVGIKKFDGGWGGVVGVEKLEAWNYVLHQTLIPALWTITYEENLLRLRASLKGCGPLEGARAESLSFSILGDLVHEFSHRLGISEPKPFGGERTIDWRTTTASVVVGALPMSQKLGGLPPDPPIGDPPGVVTVSLTET